MDNVLNEKRIRIYGEIPFFISLIIMALGCAMTTSAGFGISMVDAPAYILSQAVPHLTFGMSEWCVQAVMFIVFCIVIKKFKPVYLFSFLACLIFGLILDFWRFVIPIFNESIYPAGSFNMPVRILLFTVGAIIVSFSVALGFKSYLYPQVNDFLVRGIRNRYDLKMSAVKYSFDAICLVVSITMSLAFFGNAFGHGIGIGTLILVVINGFLLEFNSRWLDKVFLFEPKITKLANIFKE